MPSFDAWRPPTTMSLEECMATLSSSSLVPSSSMVSFEDTLKHDSNSVIVLEVFEEKVQNNHNNRKLEDEIIIN
jgi:hypothetical protein